MLTMHAGQGTLRFFVKVCFLTLGMFFVRIFAPFWLGWHSGVELGPYTYNKLL
jgi:hypothetical protein